ncbi:Crp/Fnr family transcriptional regulator [Peptoniphilus sp. KCTC 25270]|uniref:Crp/Fnr family transcriptional regulator n=1 Tax=Peptoniphilus sp. KCTC 25270 TaxID=2897414 RepID=UPI001E3FD03E|nr:Crp/Fnr family transcriptional regulator [Peptoniphilus sp. KCTC 25270]MCD1147504.1 Crp/Fnr family transcriptional regulator [Peptoniphilus sp. KCTC 25270]
MKIFLKNTSLFQGIQEEEIKALLPCLGAHKKSFQKGEILYQAGDTIEEVGLVLEGSVNIVVNFYWGDSVLFGHIPKGEIFGETYAAIPGKELLCDVVAAEKSSILFLNMNHLFTTCQKSCSFHNRLVHNLIQISAQKNLNLSQRMLHTASKSIRGRLLSYLSEQSIKNNSRHFQIPFSRQELADYLGVDRSALSNELSKMQREGFIEYKKNDFLLKEGGTDF